MKANSSKASLFGHVLERCSFDAVHVGEAERVGRRRIAAGQTAVVVGPGRPAPELDDPRRRYYEITERGREVVSSEAARLDRLLQVARSKKLLPASGPS